MFKFHRFEIRGNRNLFRTKEEMSAVDRTMADLAFKKYKEGILDETLGSRGFLKYKTNAYVRKNTIDLLEYIDLQKERYGSRTFTVNYDLTPLSPKDCMDAGPGGRLGELICGRDIWWDYVTDEAAQVSFQNVSDAIEKFLLPWFEKHSDQEYIRKKLQKCIMKLI